MAGRRVSRRQHAPPAVLPTTDNPSEPLFARIGIELLKIAYSETRRLAEVFGRT